jgi:dTDP-4-dehydrorhamnose 3,5-epimerase
MIVRTTALPDVYIIEPTKFIDNRGYFCELYNEEYLATMGITCRFVQDNCSVSRKNVLRGLHYQINKPQAKLVRATKGTIFDVAVDIRKNSQTYGKWIGVELSDENNLMLYVPAGFAHGFYTLSNEATVHYKCSDKRHPEFERSLRWNDENIGIKWPYVSCQEPIMSEKDQKAMTLLCAELSNQLA